MKKMQQKSKRIQIYKIEHKLPLNQAIEMANTKFPTQEGSKQNTSFLNGKNHTPPKVENTKLYQLSLEKPQDKLRPLKQQSKSMLM
jgi:hypothetical protein